MSTGEADESTWDDPLADDEQVIFDMGRDAERKAIVAWLRSKTMSRGVYHVLADAIRACEHLEKTEEP